MNKSWMNEKWANYVFKDGTPKEDMPGIKVRIERQTPYTKNSDIIKYGLERKTTQPRPRGEPYICKD